MKKALLIAALISAVPIQAANAAPEGVSSYSVGKTPQIARISSRLQPLTPQLTQSQLRQVMAGAASSGRDSKPGAIEGSSDGRRSRAGRAPSNYGSNCGTSGNKWGCISYTNARVANSTVSSSASTSTQPVGGMPYVATGKLLIATSKEGEFNSWCSASLIGKGILVTAAHCVHDYGKGDAGFFKSFRFIPANNSTSNTGPYGYWDASTVWIPTVYKNGTDTCSTTGIVCNNDVATVILKKNSKNQYPSDVSQIGYYGYGWNGYGFIKEKGAGRRSPKRSAITQLGYPGGLDNGFLMQRGDSYAKYTGSGRGKSPLNLIIGSQMNGGSSGGPWLINFGTPSSVGSSSAGAKASRNIVQATTSWGYTSNTIQIQGASTFAQNSQFPSGSYTEGGRDYGAGNIGALVKSVCGASGSNGQALGACF